MYVIKRVDQKGGYVALPGSYHSYTKSLERSQIFTTKEKAKKNCCGNEIVISVSNILGWNVR